jgi:hypothetical protein
MTERSLRTFLYFSDSNLEAVFFFFFLPSKNSFWLMLSVIIGPELAQRLRKSIYYTFQLSGFQ